MNNFCKNCGKKLDGKECDCNKVIENNIISKEEKNIDKVDNRFEVKDVKKSINNNDCISVSTTKKHGNSNIVLIIIMLLLLALLGDIFIVKHIKNNFIDNYFEDYTVSNPENTDNLYDDYENNYDDKNQDVVIEEAKVQYYESPFYNFNTTEYNSIWLEKSNLKLYFNSDSLVDTADIFGSFTNSSGKSYNLNFTAKYYDSSYNEIGTCSTDVYVVGGSNITGRSFSCVTSPYDLYNGKTVNDISYYKVFVDNVNLGK